MKTPEDEAFDEMAKKQDAWGGGFKAKQAMAADKLQEPAQEPVREALKLALEAMKINLTLLEKVDPYDDQEDSLSDSFDLTHKAITAIKEALATPPVQEPVKLWLWKNFVDGKPEYWAYDNPFPIFMGSHDPQTLGEPCGYAWLKPSRVGREPAPNFKTTTPPQREWVGLTAEDFSAIKFPAEMRFPAEFRAGARWAEVKLKEKNDE